MRRKMAKTRKPIKTHGFCKVFKSSFRVLPSIRGKMRPKIAKMRPKMAKMRPKMAKMVPKRAKRRQNKYSMHE